MSQSHRTRREAEEAAEKMLAGLPGDGWVVDIHENLGWYCSCRYKHITVYESFDGQYHTLIAESLEYPGSGCPEWSGDTTADTPMESIKKAMENVRKFFAKLKKVEESINEVEGELLARL